jgi:peptide/nickel transport system permease protein
MLRFYPTDVLLLLTVLAMGVFLLLSLRQEHLRRPWRKVMGSATGLVSALLLGLFTGIAVLDSVRIDQGSQTLSLLDLGLSPLRTSTEKTYSEPLGVFASVHEMVRESDGRESWKAPRLVFGGRHLHDPKEDRPIDLMQRFFKGGILGGGGGAFLALLTAWILSPPEKRPAFSAKIGWTSLSKPLRAVMITWVILGALIGITGALAGGYHVLGTDKVGNDVLFQCLKGIRTGIVIGTLTTLATLPLSLGLGILAGFYRGWVDDVIQYLYTTLNAVPGVLLIAAAMLVMESIMARHEALFQSLSARADFRLLALCLILGITSWTGLCRLIRAETLKLREMEYVQAARILGVSEFRILLRHILPNLFHLVLISVALDFSSLVLAEAVLSYINIGVDPSTESWGNMINTARLELARDPPVWWSLLGAFGFMFCLVLCANLLADVLRDAFDPKRENAS